ncbi:hypothetical protein [Salinisphaera sp.]|uniref:hypothetical protein n=1 Tax=Salinisphaera sp. TaxID=1914330 RepID=UPI002D78990C|nr:hypothetical protein [Salinisphaera sp.]HET7313644.1 hypothetical protein [Salinisphaera sp.]
MTGKSNWSKVRDKIDAGDTKDKVRAEDPATVPLGTDEEAGGRTTPEEEIARTVADDRPARRAKPPVSRKPRMDETDIPARLIRTYKRWLERLSRR